MAKLDYSRWYNFFFFPVTPFDVVKVRLQTQQRAQLSRSCYLYCNGLMDHICKCAEAVGINSEHSHMYGRTVQLNGTVVSIALKFFLADLDLVIQYLTFWSFAVGLHWWSVACVCSSVPSELSNRLNEQLVFPLVKLYLL